MEISLKSVATTACRRWLRPLVRLLIRSGITWKEFADLAKDVYVDVATRDFGKRGRPTNIARTAVLTGINRREVARLRELLAAQVVPEPAYLNAAQRVLSGWHQDRAFLDASGAPIELTLHDNGDGDGAASFDALCDRYAGDMPPTVLIKELLAVGAVVEDPAGRLRVLSRTYIPAQADPDKVLRAGSVLEDIGGTVLHDLFCPSGEPLRFERRAENDRIDAQHLPAFREYLEREGQAFLERVDDWLTQHEVPADRIRDRKVIRLGVGTYHIQTEARPAQGAEGY